MNGVAFQINNHMIPFAYGIKYEQAKASLEGKRVIKEKKGKIRELQVWKAKEFGGLQRIFSHIRSLVDTGNEQSNTIGTGYTLIETTRYYFGLTPHVNRTFTYENKEMKFEFAIKNVDIYLFETQIGFLSYEIDFKTEDEEAIIKRNCILKNLYSHKDNFFVEEYVNKEKQLVRVTLHRCIEKILEDLNITTFFENKDKFPKQALVYSSLCLNSTPNQQQIAKQLFMMKRVFKESYKPSAEDMDIKRNKDSMQLFDNSYWGISLEGFANLTYLVDDNLTNTFLIGNYKGNLQNDYYYMYLIALHQRYALLKFSIDVSKIKKINSDSLIEAEVIDEIQQIKHHIAYFYLRAMFSNISNITHQAKLYDLIRENLRINELMNEIHSELEGLNAILEQRKNKLDWAEEKEKQERQHTFNVFIAVISVVFVVLQTINSVWDMFNKWDQGIYPLAGTIKFYGLCAVSGIIILGSIYLTVLYLKKLKN